MASAPSPPVGSSAPDASSVQASSRAGPAGTSPKNRRKMTTYPTHDATSKPTAATTQTRFMSLDLVGDPAQRRDREHERDRRRGEHDSARARRRRIEVAEADACRSAGPRSRATDADQPGGRGLGAVRPERPSRTDGRCPGGAALRRGSIVALIGVKLLTAQLYRTAELGRRSPGRGSGRAGGHAREVVDVAGGDSVSDSSRARAGLGSGRARAEESAGLRRSWCGGEWR